MTPRFSLVRTKSDKDIISDGMGEHQYCTVSEGTIDLENLQRILFTFECYATTKNMIIDNINHWIRI